jgi:hypothetical protein
MFGIEASADAISNLRVLGIVPLIATLIGAFVFRQKQVQVLAVGVTIYLLYQAGIFLFVHPIS